MISCRLSLLLCHIHVISKEKKKTLFTKMQRGQEINKLLLTEKHLIVGFRATAGL